MKKETILQLFSSGADPPVHCYTQEEERLLRAHMAAHFGAPQKEWKEAYPAGVRGDVAVVGPTAAHNHYTLLTIGMGAFVMNVPADLNDCELERAELMMCLSPRWKIGRVRREWGEWGWPLTWLRILARLPLEKDLWLGWGHMIPTEGPVTPKTAFSCMLLTDPLLYGEEASYCEMPDGSVVNLYQVTPLYEDEMEYRRTHGTDALLEAFRAGGGIETAAVTAPGPRTRPHPAGGVPAG
jgi:hypothetical protein